MTKILFGALAALAAALLSVRPVLACADVTVAYSTSGPLTPTLFVAATPSQPDQNAGYSFLTIHSTRTRTSPFAGATEALQLLSLSTGTTYYIFGWVDVDGNSQPNGTEPMGGFGPFPHPGFSSFYYYPGGNQCGGGSEMTFALTNRGVISGSVDNQSSQSGNVVVEAHQMIGNSIVSTETIRRIELTDYQTGNFTLDTLFPSATPYFVQAFVDQNFNFNPDLNEDKSAHYATVIAPISSFTVTTPTGPIVITGDNSALGGQPDHVGIRDDFGGWYQSISAGNSSSNLRVGIQDFNGNLTVHNSSVTATFSAFQNGTPLTYNNPPGPGQFVLTEVGVGPVPGPTPALGISSGSSTTADFKFVPGGPGYYTLQAVASNFLSSGQQRFAYYDINVLAAGSGFSNLTGVTNSGTQASGGAITITPDYDAANDSVLLSVTPPDANGDWELIISKLPFSNTTATTSGNIVWRQSGFGSPAQSNWYGQDQNDDYRTVINGTYYARFQTPGGGITSGTLAVTVNTAFIQGTVTRAVGGQPVNAANVNVWGQGGGGYAQTNSNGNFFVAGLKSGQFYTVEVGKSGFASKRVENVQASAIIPNDKLKLDQGATIKVVGVAASSPTFDIWGGIFVHNSDFSSTAGGPARIRAGQTTIDNGLWPGSSPNFTDKDPEFSTFTLVGVLPNTPYTVELFLSEYGNNTQTVTTGGSASTTTVTFSNLQRKASISGTVEFPSAVSTPYGGEWVSVDGTKQGASFPAVFGGGYVQNGQTSSQYTVFGLEGTAGNPVNYTLRAFARGFKSQTKAVTVNGDLTNQNFGPFQEGGKITGTVNIIGDSSNVSFDSFFGGAGGGGACSPGQIPIFINAWSPQTFFGSFTQVCFTTGTANQSVNYEMKGLDDGTYEMFTFLSGFQLDPPVFPIRVTVSNRQGNKDITFRSLTGRIGLQVTYPNGHNPSLIQYSLKNRGPDNVKKSGTLGGNGSVLITGLGTGLYEISLFNPQNGLRKQTGVSVINGQLVNVIVPMDEQTFSIAGTVSMQGNITISTNTGGTNTSVVVSSITGLNTQFPPAPKVQAFAFPLPEHFNGDSVEPYAQVGVTPANGNFIIGGLLPGSYLIRTDNEIIKLASTNCGPDGCPPAEVAFPEFATTQQVVFVGSDHESGKTLTISNGAKLSGTISRPSGDSSKDQREFTLDLRRADNLVVWRSTVSTGGTGTASYSFPHLSAADYILHVFEKINPSSGKIPKYTSKPKRITMTGSDQTQNITLLQAGAVVGKLRDADSQTLITSQNKGQFLPGNFFVNAEANPWEPGGFAPAEFDQQNCCGVAISSITNQFAIYRLVPDTTYDVNFRGFEDFGQQSAARGQKAYAPVIKSGVRIAAGQTVDIGVIDLKQGVNVAGSITDTNGNALPNIRVEGVPSLENGGNRHDFSVRTFTNSEGKYNLQGIDREKLYYDVVASPRFESGDIFGKLSGKKYGQETKQMIDVTDSNERTGVDFSLTEANGVLIGKVTTADGGALELPNFGDGGEFSSRGAAIFLHEEGASFSDNPLGEIEEISDVQGNFRIDALKPGTYRMLVVSVGYITHREIVVVSEGTTNAGTVSLERGSSISGTITKPNGQAPNRSEVNLVVGVDEEFEDFIFGKVSSNSDTKLVTGYELSGFRSSVNYFVVIVTGNDDILEAAADINFTSAGQSKTVNLIFQPPPPSVIATQSRSGSRFTIRFIPTQKVRNLTSAEQSGDSFVTCTSCSGNIVSQSLSSSRDIITVVYDAAANEKTFTFNLAFTSIQENAETGTNFTFSQDYRFFAGAARMRMVQIPNILGGRAILEGDPTGGSFTSGNFDVSRSSRVEVGIVSAATLSDLSLSAPAAGPAARAQSVQSVAQRLGPEAYPNNELYSALQLAPNVSPFSAFYDIFLPAGVSRTLKKEALLTLTYDASVTDTSKINIYFYDANNNVFLLENNKRKVDTKNRTITVGVNHASTFVVLNNNAPIVGANTYAGTEFLIHNFPNPFNLKSKTVTLSQAAAGSASQTIEGTMIRYAVPSGFSGTAKFDIYNVSGELVRTITETVASGGAYYYTEWNGRNDAGKKVASGVYIARFTLNDSQERFFKMAVLK